LKNRFVTEAIKSSDDTIIKNLIDSHIPSILDCLILSEEKNPYSLSLELALINIPHYKQILEGNENWKQKKNALTAVLEEKKTKEESEKQAKRLLIEEIDKELEDLQKKNKPLENRNTEKLVETLTNEVKQLEINTQKLKQKKEENEIWQVKGPKKENINTKKQDQPLYQAKKSIEPTKSPSSPPQTKLYSQVVKSGGSKN